MGWVGLALIVGQTCGDARATSIQDKKQTARVITLDAVPIEQKVRSDDRVFIVRSSGMRIDLFGSRAGSNPTRTRLRLLKPVGSWARATGREFAHRGHDIAVQPLSSCV